MRTKLRLMTPASLWARKLNSTLIPSEPSVVANQHSFYGTENSSCFVETDSQFQNPRHTFCILVHDEWGRSLRLARILGHSKNIKMTERYTKLARQLSPGPAARRARRGSY